MFTKEIVLTLPLMIVLYEFCFFGLETNTCRKNIKNINWKHLAPFLIMLLIIPLTMAGARSINLGEIGRLAEETQTISRGHYLLTQFRVLTTYLRLLFVPLNQNLDYDYPISLTLFHIPTLLSFLLLLLILTAGVVLFRRYRLVSFCIFFFFLTLSVESSIIPIRDVIFEHRLYLPMAGYTLFLERFNQCSFVNDRPSAGVNKVSGGFH